MKKFIPQFEFAACAGVFNLASETTGDGETLAREHFRKLHAAQDSGPALFVDRLEVNKGRALIAGEMMFES